MTIYMKRKKVIDTDQYIVVTRVSYEAEILVEEGRQSRTHGWQSHEQ